MMFSRAVEDSCRLILGFAGEVGEAGAVSEVVPRCDIQGAKPKYRASKS